MIPPTTGMTAARTPVTGATMPIRPIGEAAVQRGDADPAEDTGHDAQQQVGPGRHRLAADDGDGHRDEHPDELRQRARRRRPVRAGS